MEDPREIIDREPMSRFQWGIVAVMVGLNALDGFDVLSISFASPSIAQDWGIDRAALGVVLSMELIGMAVGSLLLGNIADRLGRRRTILACLIVMAAGMLGAALAGSIVGLSVARVVTGLGIGGMLAATNAAVAEAANAHRRALCVVLMAAGYPFGSIIGGSISAELLAQFGWRAVFLFGCAVTLMFIPLVLWRAPESIAFEMHRRGRGALDRVNRTLQRMGHATVDALPEPVGDMETRSGAQFLSARFLPITIMLTVAYLAHIMTFYYILKWIPKIVVDMGFPASSAAVVLVWASIGGAAGSLLLGLMTLRYRVLALTIAAMFMSTGFVVLFGQGWQDLGTLSIAAAAAGFFTNAGVVGIYAIVAHAFPTAMRAGATGVIIGIGRGGSALAPALAGLLFEVGVSLPVVSLLMGLGSTVAAVALLVIARRLSSAPAQR